MIYFLYDLLKRILFMEQEWNKELLEQSIKLDDREKRLDVLFKLFDILVIRKSDIPETGDFVLKFKRFDIESVKPGEDIAKYAIIEKDE